MSRELASAELTFTFEDGEKVVVEGATRQLPVWEWDGFSGPILKLYLGPEVTMTRTPPPRPKRSVANDLGLRRPK